MTNLEAANTLDGMECMILNRQFQDVQTAVILAISALKDIDRITAERNVARKENQQLKEKLQNFDEGENQ